MTKREGPKLAELLNRFVAIPADFRVEISLSPEVGELNVGALVSDLMFQIDGTRLFPHECDLFRHKQEKANLYRNHMRLVCWACWLLYEPFAHQPGLYRQHLLEWLEKDLKALAELVSADQVLEDPDRREEFVRLALNAMGLRPDGESINQAEDRLSTLNTAERVRTIEKARLAEQRAREVREAMARKQAQEAAATYGRE